mgnify:FL=1|tara:strand:+ start:66 stop:446 length:381 start_codon:yes stop_codon:yes gene_type:complete
MPALSKDTRLVMTILFVGVMSGTNVWAYSAFGLDFPYGPLAHSFLFGLGTIGSIMVMKALFDLALNDRIEMWLLDRKIEAFWARKGRDEQQKQKLRENAKQYSSFQYQPVQEEENVIGNEFLAALQ